MIGRKKKSCLALLMEPSRLFFTTANQFFDTVYFTDPTTLLFKNYPDAIAFLQQASAQIIHSFSDLRSGYCKNQTVGFQL